MDQISQLTLLETADLVSNLKVRSTYFPLATTRPHLHILPLPEESNHLTYLPQTRLNIPDTPISAFTGGPASPTAAAAAEEAEDAAAAPAAQEKTLFTLSLKSFEASAKPKIIKEIKSMLGLSLVDSKKFVEAAPKVMKEGVPKEEGEKIVEVMKGLGGVVTLE